MKGDLINKISPNPSLPKRGIGKKICRTGNEKGAYFKFYPRYV
jgi:hypothetical protein